MRPGQQNKRMRGRGRRGPNPLSRSYESNGPDVKVRGTAAHIAEKYMQLARDAHASGDPVMGESYLQHAEHYFRIIAAAQSQVPPSASGEQPRPRGNGAYDGDDDRDESDEETPAAAREAAPEVSGEAPPAPEPAAPAANGDATTPPPRRRRRRASEEASKSGALVNGDNGAGSAEAPQEDPAPKATDDVGV